LLLRVVVAVFQLIGALCRVIVEPLRVVRVTRLPDSHRLERDVHEHADDRERQQQAKISHADSFYGRRSRPCPCAVTRAAPSSSTLPTRLRTIAARLPPVGVPTPPVPTRCPR